MAEYFSMFDGGGKGLITMFCILNSQTNRIVDDYGRSDIENASELKTRQVFVCVSRNCLANLNFFSIIEYQYFR